ncbi:MAG TPA: polymorphic toxin-type HINT domain-containing protein [Lacipirellulaceae bacterium]|nr:polymorphic toxin-type HINT domain-containing protein [Lacipirellulaceae bacterium]
MNLAIRADRGWWFSRTLIGATLTCAGFFTSHPHAGASGNSGYPTTAEGLVEEAGEAAIDGDTARQFALLREAVRTDPQYQLARWQLGQVEVDGKWLTVEEAQRRTASDPDQAEYRRRRAEFGESPASQLALARWCRKNGLEEESRFHWASVLSNQPAHREALRALGVRWTDGQLLSRPEIKAAREERFETRQASREWQSRLAKWQRALARNADSNRQQTLDEIRAIDDPVAIPTLESATLAGSPTDSSPSPWRGEMSLAFVTALEGMSDHAATESLLRHALLSPFQTVRSSASDRLRYRSLHDYVPALLDSLAAPIESSFHVVAAGDGSVTYLHSLYREGSHADWSSQRVQTAVQSAVAQQIVARLAGAEEVPDPAADARLLAQAANSAARVSRRYASEAAAVEADVAAANRATAASNERILFVLANVTGQSFGLEPRQWWDWWSDYNEYERYEDRPVYESNQASYETIPPPRQCECFVRGTSVWTKIGQRPIESLELGDLVLAQDVDTGQLAYKPVIGRTVRPPSAIVKISVGGEELQSTRGHPFWVAGVGWRMAKEIEDGAVLHGITCAPRIEAVEPAINAEAYNLVVADFNTYFVGESGILVHDNTPRKPTRATLPGLVAK